MKYHSFHLVDQSPWPIIASCGILGIVLGFVKMFNFVSPVLLMVRIFLSLVCALRWTNDINDESILGQHTSLVRKGFVVGFVLFIMREILLFMGFFWSFFTNSLTPVLEIGVLWPPQNLVNPRPLGARTAGTALLLTSGAYLTWCHHSLLIKNETGVVTGMVYCLLLGELFVVVQAAEYSMSPFAVSDSALGCCFFMLTGLHGLHVLVGLRLLWLCFSRYLHAGMSSTKHVGFETAAWYWHFVDIVWLFVFSLIYAWSRREEITMSGYLLYWLKLKISSLLLINRSEYFLNQYTYLDANKFPWACIRYNERVRTVPWLGSGFFSCRNDSCILYKGGYCQR